MTRIILPVVVASLCLATWAAAHSGVKNLNVLERMEAMKVTQENTKVLGAMAKGERAFDIEEAQAAAAEIARLARKTPALFEAQEMDANSEALPVIWEQFDDFTGKSLALQAAAKTLSISIETEADLRAGLGRIGAACKACHKVYRK